MIKKIYILFFLLTIGFFLIPISSFACGNNTMKTSHKKEITSKEKNCCTKECCKKTKDSKKEKHNCNGKCNHTNCTTSSSLQFSIPTSNDFELQNTTFNFLIEKSGSYYNEANISDGFTSIWLPPKI
ncbi:MAG: hypothetical protein ABI576_02305 [Flavobacterium sp.]